MVEAALNLQGYFKISAVAEAIRRNPKYVSKFSTTWAANGWLTGNPVVNPKPAPTTWSPADQTSCPDGRPGQ